MADTAIEWATRVWNPTTGCDRVSPGCDNCYALTMAKRLKGMGSAKYQRDGDPKTSGPGFAATHHSGEVSLPMRWRKPQRIFVNSMSDLFHDDIPDMFISRVWDVMRRCPQHTFMILTKRHARMRSLLSSPEFRETHHSLGGVGLAGPNGNLEHFRTYPLPNVWLGVSAENQQWADIRIPALLDTPAAIRFLSAEPLLGPIDLLGDDETPGPAIARTGVSWHSPDYGQQYEWDDQIGIDWVIVGGESGPGARPMHPGWAERIHHQCETADIAFLFKQWGEWTPLAPMREGKFDFRKCHAMTDDGNLYEPGTLTYPNGSRVSDAYLSDFPHHNPASMYRVGKHKAGRELYHDGRTFDGYPEALCSR